MKICTAMWIALLALVANAQTSSWVGVYGDEIGGSILPLSVESRIASGEAAGTTAAAAYSLAEDAYNVATQAMGVASGVMVTNAADAQARSTASVALATAQWSSNAAAMASATGTSAYAAATGAHARADAAYSAATGAAAVASAALPSAQAATQYLSIASAAATYQPLGSYALAASLTNYLTIAATSGWETGSHAGLVSSNSATYTDTVAKAASALQSAATWWQWFAEGDVELDGYRINGAANLVETNNPIYTDTVAKASAALPSAQAATQYVSRTDGALALAGDNYATDYSVAFGTYSRATYKSFAGGDYALAGVGSFAWADDEESLVPFNRTNRPNEFAVRARGGVHFHVGTNQFSISNTATMNGVPISGGATQSIVRLNGYNYTATYDASSRSLSNDLGTITGGGGATTNNSGERATIWLAGDSATPTISPTNFSWGYAPSVSNTLTIAAKADATNHATVLLKCHIPTGVTCSASGFAWPAGIVPPFIGELEFVSLPSSTNWSCRIAERRVAGVPSAYDDAVSVWWPSRTGSTADMLGHNNAILSTAVSINTNGLVYTSTTANVSYGWPDTEWRLEPKAGDFSISVWVNPSTNQAYQMALGRGFQNLGDRWILGANATNSWAAIHGAAEVNFIGPICPTGAWSHLALVRRDSVGVFYFNGAPVQTQAILRNPLYFNMKSGGALMTPFTFGNYYSNSGLPNTLVWSGYLDAGCFSTLAWTDAEVSQLFTIGRTP